MVSAPLVNKEPSSLSYNPGESDDDGLSTGSSHGSDTWFWRSRQMLRLKSIPVLPELSTNNEKSLAPVYRALFLLAVVAPLAPSVMTVVYPEAPFFELLTQVYFAPCQGAVAIYLVSRLDKPFFPRTEKAAYFIFMMQSLLQGVQRLRVGRILVGLSICFFFLLYAVVYKILRRLRKRLALMEEQRIHSYIANNVFRSSLHAMVPIIYLASESLGCLAAESPYNVTGFDNMLVKDYNQCGNLITSNHAMAFHLSMLLIVKLYILPFERRVTLDDVKNFNLILKHQILLVTIVIASFCSLFIFATRQEATSKYSYGES